MCVCSFNLFNKQTYMILWIIDITFQHAIYFPGVFNIIILYTVRILPPLPRNIVLSGPKENTNTWHSHSYVDQHYLIVFLVPVRVSTLVTESFILFTDIQCEQTRINFTLEFHRLKLDAILLLFTCIQMMKFYNWQTKFCY